MAYRPPKSTIALAHMLDMTHTNPELRALLERLRRPAVRVRSSRYSPHQGARECARRLRQVARGILPP